MGVSIMLTLAAILALFAASVANETDLIIGGKDVDRPGKYPWQISLQMLGKHVCGGALISKDVVVTAAHCVKGWATSQYTVVTGMLERKKEGNSGKPQIVKLAKKIYNKGYPGPKMFMTEDIALLKLAEDVELSEYVQMIQMAEEGDD